MIVVESESNLLTGSRLTGKVGLVGEPYQSFSM